MSPETHEPVVIGWTEYIDLPDWGVSELRAKVDTGARSSALHVENVTEMPRGFVAFDVVLHRAQRDRRVRVRAKVTRRGRVRSSTGHLTQRMFVETTLVLGPVRRTIEISLVDRERMIHRMLLGRSALGPFLIDVDRRSVQRKRKASASQPAKAKSPREGAGPKKKKRSSLDRRAKPRRA